MATISASGANDGAEAEPEVERRADHEREVGAAQPGAARAREGQLVVGGNAAARQAVDEHRDPELLGQRQQRLLAPAPVEAGAGHDHRPLRFTQRDRGAVDLALIGAGAPPWLGQ